MSDSRRTFYRLVNDKEEHFYVSCGSGADCSLPPPEFAIPPPPVPPWALDQDCEADSLQTIQTCDNTLLLDSTSRLHHDDTLQNVLVILVCSILLVVIVLAVAVVIWRRRTRFLRSLMHDEHKPEDSSKGPPPPADIIELRENPDSHVFSNPNYPTGTINIGGLPFYLLPAKEPNPPPPVVDGGSYVSSSILTVGPIYEDIDNEEAHRPAIYFNSNPQPGQGVPEAAGTPSSHTTTSSSEVSMDSSSSPQKTVFVNPSGHHQPRPSPRSPRVYYYSDTLRNSTKNPHRSECESDSGISNSRTSTEEGTPPTRLRIPRKTPAPPPPPSLPTPRMRAAVPLDTTVSVKSSSYKGSVQV